MPTVTPSSGAEASAAKDGRIGGLVAQPHTEDEGRSTLNWALRRRGSV